MPKTGSSGSSGSIKSKDRDPNRVKEFVELQRFVQLQQRPNVARELSDMKARLELIEHINLHNQENIKEVKKRGDDIDQIKAQIAYLDQTNVKNSRHMHHAAYNNIELNRMKRQLAYVDTMNIELACEHRKLAAAVNEIANALNMPHLQQQTHPAYECPALTDQAKKFFARQHKETHTHECEHQCCPKDKPKEEKTFVRKMLEMAHLAKKDDVTQRD